MFERCPQCKRSFRGELIPPDQRHLFGGARFFSTKAGIEDPEVYDGVIRWRCPYCDHEWPREGFEHV
jgi:hypothetical protein